MKGRRAILLLEDGLSFEGYSFGFPGEAIGEVVFNTSMTGYQEILTDPSYKGQMVVMTYPEIGNYGVNQEDVEATRPFVEGFIVRNYNEIPSNFRSRESLGRYLGKNRIPGIYGIDTRLLTQHLRECGAKLGIISTIDLDKKRALKKVRSVPSLVGQDLVKEVSCQKPYRWREGTWRLGEGYLMGGGRGFKVVAYDFGIKRNILRNLVDLGCDVTVVPAFTPASEVLKMRPDGVFLSNGPGDPEPVTYAVESIQKLIGKIPIFGICLGHQLLSLALGGRTYKLKFGHHGGNHPVKNRATGQVEITAQNHGFAVEAASLRGKAELTHINLNDQTVEGMRHTKFPIFSVQYHPEASPGPHDSNYLFKGFVELMKGRG